MLSLALTLPAVSNSAARSSSLTVYFIYFLGELLVELPQTIVQLCPYEVISPRSHSDIICMNIFIILRPVSVVVKLSHVSQYKSNMDASITHVCWKTCRHCQATFQCLIFYYR